MAEIEITSVNLLIFQKLGKAGIYRDNSLDVKNPDCPDSNPVEYNLGKSLNFFTVPQFSHLSSGTNNSTNI